MKKIFFLVLLGVFAVMAQAQCTWNVRAGFGTIPHFGISDYTNNKEIVDNYAKIGASVVLQCNIPISKSYRHTFSPTLISNFNKDNYIISGLFQYGYRFGTGEKGIFFPKIGISYSIPDKKYQYYGDKAVYNIDNFFGGSLELAYEYKHFVMTTTYIPSWTDKQYFHGFSFTLGLKF